MRKTLADLSRLLLLIALLPLLLLMAGPLLVLAVVRGRQGLGPLILDASRYDPAGQAGMFMLGLAVWLLSWSSLAWLLVTGGGYPGPELWQWLRPTAPAVVRVSSPTPTSPPVTPSPSPTRPAATPTAQPTLTATFTATPTSTPWPSPTLPIQTATFTPEPTVTPPSPATATPTPTPPPTATPTPTASPTPGTPTATPTPWPTLTFVERRIAINTVRQANTLLREAITAGDEQSLDNLEAIWRGKALTLVEQFAADLNERYAQPFIVSLDYLSFPAITGQSGLGEATITSRELWSYGDSAERHQEAFEFIYFLEREGGGVGYHRLYLP